MAVLPPWLQIAPEQFTRARIAGGEQGQRSAAQASEIVQRAIQASREIANRAEALQVQRESIAAELAGRQAAASQRAQEAAGEIGIKQQQFDEYKRLQDDVAARRGQNDVLAAEGRSRYDRAINSGETPAAADLEILQPLRDTGVLAITSAPVAPTRAHLFKSGDDVVSIAPNGVSTIAYKGKEKVPADKYDPIEKLNYDKALGSAYNRVNEAHRAVIKATDQESRDLAQGEYVAAREAIKKLEKPTFVATPGTATTAAPKVFQPPVRPPTAFIGDIGGANQSQLPAGPGMGGTPPPQIADAPMAPFQPEAPVAAQAPRPDTGYNSAEDVRAAFRAKKINRETAKKILEDQFNLK